MVLGHDPWKRYRLHPDHRNAGFLVTDGIVAARDPLFFPELDALPHRPETLLLFEADEPDHLEDVTQFVDAKLAALLEHRSQLRSTMGIAEANALDYGEHPEVVEFKRRVTERLSRQRAQRRPCRGRSLQAPRRSLATRFPARLTARAPLTR